MADDRPLDPAKLMRAFFSAWDQGRALAPQAQPANDQPGDAPAMRLMAQALAVANMPSREDVHALAERLDRIEALLAGLDRRLGELENSASRADQDEAATAAKKQRKKKR